MPGGLLNIVAYGNQNIILNGNPSKTFYKCVYAKYTNFGLQKFRIDYSGLRELRMNEESKFSFKMPRYADLLMDTYVVVNLPNIWSPLYPPQTTSTDWRPYEFKWIKNIGTTMIKEINISAGGQVLQKITGSYLHNIICRDNTNIALFNEMTGNVSELNDPANAYDRGGEYPNAYYTEDTNGAEPSIRGRKIYIPIGAWFTFASKMAFPLVCLQYNQLTIEVTIRPVKELFVVNDVTSSDLSVIQPNFNESTFGFYRFIQEPPNTSLTYTDKTTSWNADIHLISTYCFLSEDETKVFAADEQKYLIKDVREEIFKNVVGTKKIKLNTGGLVADWMWFFRRSDAYLRNEWTNYTNWPYDYLPDSLTSAPSSPTYTIDTETIGPDTNPSGTSTGLYTTGTFSAYNQKYIMNQMGILMDGKYRENELDSGIYNYLEKYTTGNNSAYTNTGLYSYNFCIHTSLYDTQPSGAINLSKFSNVEFELTTYIPPVDLSAQFFNICDDNGEVIGVNKFSWDVYEYTYDLHVLEERYNIIHFMGGNVSKMFAT
tara:strand:+ start:42320 stop:43948 length:1629 start_codon:yes stop_codon:yes gene_type:complete